MNFTGPAYPTSTDAVANGGFFTSDKAIGVTGALPAGATLDDAFTTALNWEVVTDTAVNGATLDVVPNFKFLRRSDTDEVLGWGKDGFTVIQPSECKDILQGGLADTPYEVAAAMSLRGGRRIAIIVKLLDHGDINTDGETIKTFLALTNSFDASSALRLLPLAFRPSCTNMLSMFWSRKGAREAITSIRHTRSAQSRFADVKSAIRRYTSVQDEFQAEVQRLIRTEVTGAQANKVLEALAPIPTGEDVSKSRITRAENYRDAIVDLYHNDPRVGFTGTAWGLLQAASTYAQNDSGFRVTATGPRDRSERKVEKALAGEGVERKALAIIERTLVSA